MCCPAAGWADRAAWEAHLQPPLTVQAHWCLSQRPLLPRPAAQPLQPLLRVCGSSGKNALMDPPAIELLNANGVRMHTYFPPTPTGVAPAHDSAGVTCCGRLRGLGRAACFALCLGLSKLLELQAWTEAARRRAVHVPRLHCNQSGALQSELQKHATGWHMLVPTLRLPASASSFLLCMCRSHANRPARRPAQQRLEGGQPRLTGPHQRLPARLSG